MLEYTLIRSARKTISIEITPDCRVVVRAPKRCSNQEIQEFVMSREPWARKHLSKMEERNALRKEMLGEIQPLTEAELEELTAAAKKEFPERVRKWTFIVFEKDLTKLGKLNGRVTIRHQKTRWGSCSSKGTLNFNCLLMLAPEDVRDYVVVHELCHLLHMDHSQKFWAEVRRAMPHYKEPLKWLKQNEVALMARLPR